jgi:hypothetical protein
MHRLGVTSAPSRCSCLRESSSRMLGLPPNGIDNETLTDLPRPRDRFSACSTSRFSEYEDHRIGAISGAKRNHSITPSGARIHARRPSPYNLARLLHHLACARYRASTCLWYIGLVAKELVAGFAVIELEGGRPSICVEGQ